MNLFIIGNGFDLAHNMKTRYSDFKKYLIKKYSIKQYEIDNSVDIPTSTIDQYGDDVYEDRDVVLTILRMFDSVEGERWQDIESTTGSFDYSIFLDTYDDNEYNIDKYTYYNNDDNATNLCGALKLIPNYFNEWVKTIQIVKKPINEIRNLITNGENLFLNFNYTQTLETLYKIKEDQVCHIHGTQDKEIYFGHGNDDFDIDKTQSMWFGAEDEIEDFHQCLRKNTKSAYNKNIDFFNRLYRLKDSEFSIYSYGFSFSDVDMPYLEKIFENINTNNVKFYINDYDSSEKIDLFSNKIKKSFNGTIETIHIN